MKTQEELQLKVKEELKGVPAKKKKETKKQRKPKEKKEKKAPAFEDHLRHAFPNKQINELYELLSPPREELTSRVKAYKKGKKEKEEATAEKNEDNDSTAMSLSIGKVGCEHFRNVVLANSLKNLLLEVIKDAANDGTSQIDKYVVAKTLRRSLMKVLIANSGDHAFATCAL